MHDLELTYRYPSLAGLPSCHSDFYVIYMFSYEDLYVNINSVTRGNSDA